MTASLQKCPPCNCSYGSREVYNVTAQAIQKWLSQANVAGKTHGLNPVNFLAIASIETNGDYSAIDPDGSTYGIVQVDKNHLNAYNCLKGTKYTMDDLIGEGNLVTTSSGAVKLSFDILGYHLKAALDKTNSLKSAATAWNGAICGGGGINPYGTKCGGFSYASSPSCYGEAVYKLASAYSGWFNNDSRYTSDLKAVPTNTLSTYNTVCFGK